METPKKGVQVGHITERVCAILGESKVTDPMVIHRKERRSTGASMSSLRTNLEDSR